MEQNTELHIVITDGHSIAIEVCVSCKPIEEVFTLFILTLSNDGVKHPKGFFNIHFFAQFGTYKNSEWFYRYLRI